MSNPYLDSQVGRLGLNIAAGQVDAPLLPAFQGKRIRVLALAITATAAGATTAVINSKGSGAGTAISNVFALAANEGADLKPNLYGWCDSEVGEALTLTTGAGAGVGIQVVYSLW